MTFMRRNDSNSLNPAQGAARMSLNRPMYSVTASELATRLGVSRPRVSQLVADGRLNGCFTGQGRLRRFDPAKAAETLARTLDPAQMLGNGAKTRMRLGDLAQEGQGESRASEKPAEGGKAAPPAGPPAGGHRDGALGGEDADAYTLVRTAKVHEELRRMRRQNEIDAGTLVLAVEVERLVARVLKQELAEVEEMLRTGARAIADVLEVDFKRVRKILLDTWREKRRGRRDALAETAGAAALTPAEKAADF